MTATNSKRIVQHIRRLAGAHDGTTSDAELLRRYLADHDQSAFAELVRRHGAMVFAVCRSVLRQHDDAEDAFQAVFLILSRKAGAIRKPNALGSWLHGVAHRVALKARAENARRQAREANAISPTVSESACDDLSWGELRAVLHAELAALPERFRAPLILCYLEGLTQDESAMRLGCTAATVKGRLQRGREKLRRRLERRGVALTAALAAALTGQVLSAATVQGLRPFTTETTTEAAKTLAGGMLRPLMGFKLAVISAVLLSVGLGAAGMGMLLPRPEGEEPAPAGKPSTERSIPQAMADVHGDPLPDGAIARLGTVRFNQGQGLHALLFTPDDKTILSAGDDSLRIWDAATGAEKERITTVRASFDHQIVLTDGGKTLISLNQESTGVKDVVRVYDLARRKEVRKLPLPVRRLESSIYRRNALAPDGALAAINLPTEMRVFDLTTGRELHKLAKGGKEIRDVVFAGSDQLVTVDTKRIIDVWEARTGNRIRQFDPAGPVEVLASSGDGKLLATLEHRTDAIDHLLEKDVVQVWDLATGTRKHTLTARPKRWVMRIFFTPDNKRLLVASYGSEGYDLTVWDSETGERVREIPEAAGTVLAVSTDGKRLAAGNQLGKFDLWDMQTGRCLSAKDSRHARAASLRYSSGGDRVFSLSFSSLSTWDAATGQRKDSFELPSHRSMPPMPALSPGGRFALIFHGEGMKAQGLVWDVARKRHLYTLENWSITNAFSPDSSLLATWESEKEKIIRLRDARTGRVLSSFPGRNVGWPILSFTANGKTLFAIGEKITAFDVVGGKELFSWRMKHVPDHSGVGFAVGGKVQDPNQRRAWRGLAVSPDGALLAVTLDGGFGRQPLKERVELFDARTGKLLRRWSDSGQPSRSFEELAFSHDGSLLASTDGDVIHLWEVATGKIIFTFRGHYNEINALVFRDDDRLLASASWDSTVLIWDLTQRARTARTVEDIAQCWKDLAGEKAASAQHAIWALAQSPEMALPFLKGRIRPVEAIDPKRLRRLIGDLDSEQFKIRESATLELGKLGELAESALRAALANQPTLEQRRRIEPILNKLEEAVPAGEQVRLLRAVRVLEHTATPEAWKLLQELASGAKEARLTRQARAALARHSP